MSSVRRGRSRAKRGRSHKPPVNEEANVRPETEREREAREAEEARRKDQLRRLMRVRIPPRHYPEQSVVEVPVEMPKDDEGEFIVIKHRNGRLHLFRASNYSTYNEYTEAARTVFLSPPIQPMEEQEVARRQQFRRKMCKKTFQDNRQGQNPREQKEFDVIGTGSDTGKNSGADEVPDPNEEYIKVKYKNIPVLVHRRSDYSSEEQYRLVLGIMIKFVPKLKKKVCEKLCDETTGSKENELQENQSDSNVEIIFDKKKAEREKEVNTTKPVQKESPYIGVLKKFLQEGTSGNSPP